jgi:2-polyprenyl-6-methoxyphenol hydroxylase-like FAD-dependent oxidoreductase
MAIELARNGVGSLVVEKHPGTSTFPKASGISTRSMELFRSWGLENAIRANSLEAEPFMSVRPTLREDRGIAAPLGFPTAAQALAVSPTRPAISPQDHVEPVLLAHARSFPGVDVRFGTELVEFDQDATGVTATICDRAAGRSSVVRARYLVGADGTRSAVRTALGIAAHGPDDLGEYMSVLFRADLWSGLLAPRFGLYQLDGPVPGVFVPAGPDDRWVLGMPWDPRAEDAASWTAERCIDLVRSASGIPDLDVEILAAMPISFVAQAAERARELNAFLVGDAAHRMPPMGGRGMNTAIADSVGLGWKLAWVLRGWAGPSLLDTYESERGPVGRYNLALASRQAPGTPDGLVEDLGYVYRSAAIEAIDAGGENAPTHLFPTVATPGARLPHAWLAGPSGRLSTLDLVAPQLTLLTGPQGQAWLAAAERWAADTTLPIAAHVVGADLDSLDGAFCERFGLGADGAILVRPDGHIAWRREAGTVVDHAAELGAAIDLVRGTRVTDAASAPAEATVVHAAASS